jgi:collagenase-like PrtC family protease
MHKDMHKINLLELHDNIKYSREKDIDFNYTFNSTHLRNKEFTREGVIEIKNLFGKLYDAGVRSVTLTLPTLIELVQSMEYDFKIRTSTLCQIRNVNRAMAFKKLGVDKIVVDESINKDVAALKKIREAFGEKVEIIVNQICDKNCMYRMFHYNMVSGDTRGTVNEVSVNYYEHRCVLQQLKTIDNLLKLCWVRPEDIKYYDQIGIHYFKLQGRHTFSKGGDPVKTAECYMKESYDGNLMDLLSMFAKLTSFKAYVDNKKLEGFIRPFLENENFCKSNCADCRYCESFAKRVIDYKKTEEMVTLAKEFYNDYDQFQKIVQSTNPDKVEMPTQDEMSIEFDID